MLRAKAKELAKYRLQMNFDIPKLEIKIRTKSQHARD